MAKKATTTEKATTEKPSFTICVNIFMKDFMGGSNIAPTNKEIYTRLTEVFLDKYEGDIDNVTTFTIEEDKMDGKYNIYIK